MTDRIAFWRRYRVRLQVSSKADSAPQRVPSVDLEASKTLESEHPPVQLPRVHFHSRVGTRTSRWPGYTMRRSQLTRPVSDLYASTYRIVEGSESGTIHHHPHSFQSSPTLSATSLPATAPAPASLKPEAQTQVND